MQIQVHFVVKNWQTLAIARKDYSLVWQFVPDVINPLDDLSIYELEPCWKVLKVKSSASSLQVERAYKRLIRT